MTQNTIIVQDLKDVPIKINDMTLIARLSKKHFEDYHHLIPKEAKQFKVFKTLIGSLEGYSQESNYGALYIEI